MKAMFTGFAAMIIIGVAAHFALDDLGMTSQARNTGADVRVD
ncbi:hypothetical protein LA6_001885 [Marinibacterium anthonyi]|nr:hypothetical protein LA6_001885 [Marinibacterium anthonyi]